MVILENCGFSRNVPQNICVIADRAFKQLDIILRKLNRRGVRPPSVMQNVKSTKTAVMSSKQIASVRIHVERIINRIRNFDLLNIHSRIDHNLFDCLDSCVFIASGLVNLQSEFTKQHED